MQYALPVLAGKRPRVRWDDKAKALVREVTGAPVAIWTLPGIDARFRSRKDAVRYAQKHGITR